MGSDEEMIEIDILHACNMDITNWNFAAGKTHKASYRLKSLWTLNRNRLAISSDTIGALEILDYPRRSERSFSTRRRLRTWNSLRRRNSNVLTSSLKTSASSASSIINIMLYIILKEIPDRQTQYLSQKGQNLSNFFLSTISLLNWSSGIGLDWMGCGVVWTTWQIQLKNDQNDYNICTQINAWISSSKLSDLSSSPIIRITLPYRRQPIAQL